MHNGVPRFLFIILFCLFTTSLTDVVKAAPSRQESLDGEEYIVQAGDWLTKIADKYYGDPQDYAGIIEATNGKAEEDDTFATISDPNLIVAGQKLWVPSSQDAGIVTVEGLSFKLVMMERLGIRTVVPAVWPAVESSDPFLAQAWRAGPFSSVNFTASPGNDAQIGLARLLSVPQQDLTGEVIGGRLSEEQFGEQTWTLFTRDDGGVASVVGATVKERVIYQVSLFAGSAQTDTILRTILENFEIIDLTAARQAITITAPGPGTRLNNPFELRGTTNQYPFRGSLIYRVLDAEGNQVGRAPFEVAGIVGNQSTFAVPGRYQVTADGAGTVEVAEISAADGTIIAIDSVGVTLVADPIGYSVTIDDPAPYVSIASPVQIRGKAENKPLQGILNYRIIDAGGRQVSSGFLQTSGESGETVLFDGFVEFTVSDNGPGRVEVYDVNESGSIISMSTVNVWLTTAP